MNSSTEEIFEDVMSFYDYKILQTHRTVLKEIKTTSEVDVNCYLCHEVTQKYERFVMWKIDKNGVLSCLHNQRYLNRA